MAETPSVFQRLVRRVRTLAAFNGRPAGAPAESPLIPEGALETAQADPLAPFATAQREPAATSDAIALADWKRHAAQLEGELEHPSRIAVPGPLVRYELIAQADPAPPGERLRIEPGVPGKPLVTVVIPVYDGLRMTLDCLRSLAEHPPGAAHAEYVVIDDASPGNLGAALAEAVDGVTIVRNGENLGFLRSCNRAARLSRADYLVFLNNDTLVRRGWLDALVETAERDQRVAIVGAKLVYPNGTLQEAGGLIWRDASGWNYGRNERADDPTYEYMREVDYCSGAALLVRRSVFDRLGGFDERYAPAYFEDSDLCFAARRAGLRVCYQPRSVVVHLEGGTSGTDVSSGVKRNQVLNHPKFREKWLDVLETQHFAHDAAQAQRAARRLQGSRTVVMIDHYVPEPDRDSGSNKVVHIIRLLRALGWHVIFMPDNYHASQPYTNDLQQLGVEVLYHVDGGRAQADRLDDALTLADLVWIGRPDIYAKYRPWLDARPRLPVVYDTHDLHYVRVARQLELLGDAATAGDRAHQKAVKEQEFEIIGNVDIALTVTDIERRTLAGEGFANVRVVPNIHVARMRTVPFDQTDGLLFIGGYNHTPNVDAVEWLVRDIMPLIWDDFPALSVTLLGSHPPPRVWDLARDPRVIVTGFVHDVEPYFQAARVFVSPLRYGAGLKGKIGQSLEYGLPVVTTTIGAEGFDFSDGTDALIADDAEGFAAAVKGVYADRKLWGRLSAASTARLAPFFPERVKEHIAAVLDEAMQRRRRRAELLGV